MRRGGGPSADCEELRLKHRADDQDATGGAARVQALTADLNAQGISTARGQGVWSGSTGSVRLAAHLSASAKIRLAREGRAKTDPLFRPINCLIALKFKGLLRQSSSNFLSNYRNFRRQCSDTFCAQFLRG